MEERVGQLRRNVFDVVCRRASALSQTVSGTRYKSISVDMADTDDCGFALMACLCFLLRHASMDIMKIPLLKRLTFQPKPGMDFSLELVNNSTIQMYSASLLYCISLWS